MYHLLHLTAGIRSKLPINNHFGMISQTSSSVMNRSITMTEGIVFKKSILVELGNSDEASVIEKHSY